MSTAKLGIGILGLGGRGVYFGERYFRDHPDCSIQAICDLREDRLANASRLLRKPRPYTSTADFLRDPDLDAVIICTPDHAHGANAIETLAAGKNVYLEKPMAQSIEECDTMIDTWIKKPGIFMVGLELRYCTLFRDMKALIESGEIGNIITGTVIDNVAVGGNYYYHGDRRRRSFIKSLILEKGTHSLDLANWLVDSSPVRVFASGGLDVFGGDAPNDKHCADCDIRGNCPYFIDTSGFTMDYGAVIKPQDLCVYAQECDVDDNSLVLIDYESGARICYMECHFTPEYSREFMFVGDKGKMTGFYNNEMEFKITVTKRHSRKQEVYFPERGEGEHGGGDNQIVEEFIVRLRAGKPCMPGVTGGRDSAAIAIAADESCRTGMPVTIPPKSIPPGEHR